MELIDDLNKWSFEVESKRTSVSTRPEATRVDMVDKERKAEGVQLADSEN